MSAATSHPPSSHARRGAAVLAAVVAVIAALGFFTGIREGLPPPAYGQGSGEASAEVTPAPRYLDLIERGPVRRWGEGGGVAALAAAAHPGVGEAGALDLDARALALADRRGLRAYDGAPPTIPHPVDPRALPCLACHGQGYAFSGRVAPPMSHEPLASCTQCHAPVAGGGPPAVEGLAQAVGESAFVGLKAPTLGQRAWPGAPPTIPHPTFMRERCSSCHGALGSSGLKTSHPWRQSCTQCHAPSAALDQRPAALADPPGVGP